MSCEKQKEVLFKLVELYRDMPHLWKKDHEDYTNKALRNYSYNMLLDVYKEFDDRATIKIIKKKIENMRTAYGKELRKVESSRRTSAGAEDVYKPSLWYFELFSFLGSRTESYSPGNETLKEENLSSQEEDIPNVSTFNCSFQQKRINSSTLVEQEEKRPRLSEQIIHKDGDEWEIFGKSIGHQMRDLDKTQLAIAQKLISDVIYYAKFNKLSEDSFVVLSNEVKLEK